MKIKPSASAVLQSELTTRESEKQEGIFFYSHMKIYIFNRYGSKLISSENLFVTVFIYIYTLDKTLLKYLSSEVKVLLKLM